MDVIIRFALALCLFSDQVRGENITEKHSSRRGKVFSLFNIVQFKNDGCQSTQTLAAGTTIPFRNGTCFTRSECMTNGGVASGGCAAGFGVCCVFVVSNTGSTVSRNCSYIQNPGFPNRMTPTAASTFSYKINKQDNSVCTIRLDFETLVLAGPTAGVCVDSLVVTTTNSPPTIPTICGINTGQHMYLSVGSANAASANLAFSLAATNLGRAWDIKITQIPCNTKLPQNCLQYFVGTTGRFTSFNFASTVGNLLPAQRYSACIRQEKGFCCIEYMTCSGASDSFTILPTAATTMSQTGAICNSAFLGIPGSSASCVMGTNALVMDQYCGKALNTLTAQPESIPICDCTAPFRLDFSISPTLAAAVVGAGIGACVTWMQLPCQ